MVELKPITILSENLRECVELELDPSQAKLVPGNAESLGEAYDENRRGGKVFPYAIYAGDTMVGLCIYSFSTLEESDEFGEDFYFFWLLMIDKRHQKKGYGRQAAQKIIAEVKTKPHGDAAHFYTSYYTKNVVSKRLFESLGFVETKEEDEETTAKIKI
ncbi:MAG: GNAT family N-acetyltransferase [Defluviitaleaceae bacterium]|nr:GNAT family N-acetyltransferase [Defluviitaleaceae bacterium]